MGDTTPDLISLDFNIEETSSGFSAVPAGTYFLTLEKVVAKESKNGNPYLSVTYNVETDEIVDPDTGDSTPVKGRKVFDALFYAEKNLAWKLGQLVKSTGFQTQNDEGKTSFDPQGMIGLTVGAIVERQPMLDSEDNPVVDDDGNPRFNNNIKRYVKPTDVG